MAAKIQSQRLSDKNINDIIKLYQDGELPIKIALKYNVTRQMIMYILKKNNIKTRTGLDAISHRIKHDFCKRGHKLDEGNRIRVKKNTKCKKCLEDKIAGKLRKPKPQFARCGHKLTGSNTYTRYIKCKTMPPRLEYKCKKCQDEKNIINYRKKKTCQ
jgi:hypothetical protein